MTDEEFEDFFNGIPDCEGRENVMCLNCYGFLVHRCNCVRNHLRMCNCGNPKPFDPEEEDDAGTIRAVEGNQEQVLQPVSSPLPRNG